jgi:hypothetical protein
VGLNWIVKRRNALATQRDDKTQTEAGEHD